MSFVLFVCLFYCKTISVETGPPTFYKLTVSLSLGMGVGLDGESGLIVDGQAGGRKAHKSDKKVEE